MTKRAKKCGNKKLSFTLNEKRERGRERERRKEKIKATTRMTK